MNIERQYTEEKLDDMVKFISLRLHLDYHIDRDSKVITFFGHPSSGVKFDKHFGNIA